MGVINGLTTVNCGQIVTTPYGVAELLGPRYSNHPDNGVFVYAAEGHLKVALGYYGSKCYIFRFKSHTELQHYWSRAYDTAVLEKNRKYRLMLDMARNIARLHSMY